MDEKRPCQFCAEDVKHEAVVCPHCRREFAKYDERGRRQLSPATIVVLVVAIALGSWWFMSSEVSQSRDKAKRDVDRQVCELQGRSDC